MHTVEEPWLPWSVPITPVVCTRYDWSFIEITKFFFGLVSTELLCLPIRLFAVYPLGFEVGGRGASDALRGRGGWSDLMFRDEGGFSDGVTRSKLSESSASWGIQGSTYQCPELILLIDNRQSPLLQHHRPQVHRCRAHVRVVLLHIIILVCLIIRVLSLADFRMHVTTEIVGISFAVDEHSTQFGLQFGGIFALSLLELLETVHQDDLVYRVQLGLKHTLARGYS